MRKLPVFSLLLTLAVGDALADACDDAIGVAEDFDQSCLELYKAKKTDEYNECRIRLAKLQIEANETCDDEVMPVEDVSELLKNRKAQRSLNERRQQQVEEEKNRLEEMRRAEQSKNWAEKFSDLCRNKFVKEAVEIAGNNLAKINEPNAQGETPLFAAVSSSVPEVVDYLLQNGAQVNVKNAKGLTPLLLSINRGNFEVFKKILEAGADVSTSVKVSTKDFASINANAIIIATYRNQVQMVEALIAAGVDINFQANDAQLMALEIANKKGFKDVAAVLQNAGGKEYFRGELLELCAKKDLTTADLAAALETKPDVNKSTRKGWTALHFVAQNSPDPESIDLLVRNGAMINAHTVDGLTPVIVAARNNPNPKIVEALVKNGALLDDVAYGNWTALMAAVAKNNEKVVEYLLNKRAPGENLVNIAIANNENIAVLKKVLDAGHMGDSVSIAKLLKNSMPLERFQLVLNSGVQVSQDNIKQALALPMDTDAKRRYRNEVLDLLKRNMVKKK